MKFITKVSVLFTFSLFAILLMACQTEDSMKKVIGITWIRSFEDDKDGTEAYRPTTYEFPPARGREGWKFEENKTVKKQAIAATDGYVSEEGTWTLTKENQKDIVNIVMENGKVNYEIISVSDSIIFLKLINE